MSDQLHLVVVEDDPALNGLIERRLTREGHNCVCFHTAGKCLEWLQHNQADLMLLDLGLPDMNGEEVVERMRDLNLNIPFIVATGQGSEAIAVSLIKKGARDYLVKNSELMNVLPSTIEMVWKEIQLENLLEKAREQIRFQNATLTAVQNLSPAGIMVADAKGAILSFNRKLLEVCGLAEEDTRKTSAELLTRFAEQADCKDDIKAALLDKEREDVDITLSRVSFNGRFLEVHSTPMLSHGGGAPAVIGRIWYFSDTTTYIEAELAMAAAKREAETHAKMKDHFLSMISHDVKTPLNSIIGFSELLELTDMNENQKDYLKNIEDSSSYLLTLVNDILDLSKIEHGAIELDIGEFILADTLNKCLDIFSSQADAKNLKLLKSFAPDMPQTIVTDELRLRQIVTNLMGNAVKFTYKGSITLACRPTPGRPDFIDIAVLDTGIGIKQEYKEFIFAPFTQENTSIAKTFGGTGLGLAIVRHLVEIFGGEIHLDSQPQKGSTFTVTIPASLRKYPPKPLGKNLF